MKIEVDADDLRPVIKAVVAETLSKLQEQLGDSDGQLAFNEAHAARLIELTERQLADERRRGRIRASIIVGRRIRYLKSDLLAYLLSRRVGK